MSGASSFVHSTTAEAGNGMETRGRAVTNEIARNCFPLAFSFSGPQIKNPYISSIHKDFFHLLQPLYQGFKSGKRDSDPRPSAWEADALPTELFPQMQRKIYGFFPLFRHLKGQKNDDSEKTPTFFRTDTAAQYECRREGKGREGKARQGKARQGKARQGKTGPPAEVRQQTNAERHFCPPLQRNRKLRNKNVKGCLVRNRQAFLQLTPSSAQPKTLPAEPRHSPPDASASCLSSVFRAACAYD